MKFRLGFLGAWALFVVGVGLAALVVAAQWANLKDAERLRRLQRIDGLIAARFGEKAEALRGSAEEREERLRQLRAQVTSTEVEIDESKDSDQTIIVSTAENRVFMRRGEEVLFQAICSTGKGTTLVEKGKKIVFETPTGRFRIVSKEESPVWIPPDWHFLEEARKKKLKLVRLTPRMAIDADTGAPVLEEHSEGIWSWFESSGRPPARLLKIKNNTVVEVRADGSEWELPAGEVIQAGRSIIVPPTSVPQRRFEKVLGRYRLNIGGGYALHGTLATDQLGRSVSHGCVRLADADLETLYKMAKVGDQVIIY